MKINICKIYKKNILNKYSRENKSEFEKKYTAKEQEMWAFTLQLIKDNYPTEEYDSDVPSNYLKTYHEIYLNNDVVPFSLKEWFEYLKSNI